MLVASVAIDAHQHPSMLRQAFALTTSHSWKALARPPFGVDGEQAVLLDDHRVLFAGGYGLEDDPEAPVPPALIYDTRHNSWTVAGSTGADHRGAQLLALPGGRALLIGGHGADGRPSADSLIFDGSDWRPAQPLPGPWARYALVTLADGSVLLIGGDRPAGAGFVAVADTMLLPIGAAQG
jgi:N-acetylneuraminic acid mutarotase